MLESRSDDALVLLVKLVKSIVGTVETVETLETLETLKGIVHNFFIFGQDSYFG